MGAVEIRLLGRFSVRRGGEEIPSTALGGRLGAALLRYLVTRRGELVGHDALAEALWVARRPVDPAANVKVLVARLRRGLGDPSLIVTGSHGYSFGANAECLVDAEAFLARLDAARSCLAQGLPDAALAELRAGLALWGGEPLAEDVYADWAQPFRRRLARAHLEALELGAGAALDTSDPQRAVALAEAAIAQEPLREASHMLLVRGLAASGDTAAALRAYDAFRLRLADDLGLDPSPDAQALQARILRHDSVALERERSQPRLQVADRRPITGEPSSPPLPPELASAEARPLVSRAGDLKRAQRFLADDTRERLGVLWLLGEPGIGKTRLAREIARRAHADGGVVLFGRCSEDLPVPYQPFLEALSWHVAHLPDVELSDRLGRAPGELTRLVPEIASGLPGLQPTRSTSPEIEQHRLFEAVRLWLAAAGGGRPLQVVLDDVHWATRPTLALLGHVARSAEAARVVLVCTARDTVPDESEALAALAEELDRRGTPSQRVELGGLDVEGVGELVGSAFGRALDDRLQTIAAQIHGETGGNPLFVDAVLASLDPAGPGWPPGEVRGTVADSVLRRVGRLPAGVVELLKTAAVAGLDFDLRVVARAVGRDQASVLAALESAVGAGLVEEAGINRHRFSHALVRSVLREELSRSRRARVHMKVGEALEEVHAGHLDEHVGALAYHFGEAEAVGAASKAFHYTVAAAERATRLLSHHEAADAYGRSLTLLERVDEVEPLSRYELLMAQGAAQRRAGDLLGALATFRAAAEEAAGKAPEAMARASVAAEETSFWLGFPGDDVAALLGRAETTLPGEESRLRALTLAGLSRALQFSGRWPESIERGNEAMDIAERLDDPATTLAVLSRANLPYLGIADAPRAAARWLEVAAGAEELGDDETYVQGMGMALWATAQVGDLAAFDRLLPTYSRLTAELRQPMMEHFLDLLRSFRTFVAGDLEAAERFLQHGEDLGEALGWAREGLYGVAMFLIRREQGRLAGLLPSVRALVRLNPAAAFWRPGLAALYAELEMLDEARSEFTDLASGGFADLPLDGTRELCLGLLAEVCTTLDDSERAGELIDLLLPCEGRLLVFLISAACLGPADRLLAMLASTAHRPDEAERWHRRGLELACRLESPLWRAHCLHDYAVSLVSSDATRAREMLAEAATLCERHSLTALARRVAHLRQDT